VPKLFWLIAFVIPPWIASALEAPKWVLLISLAPFFLLAMRMGNHEEDLLGDASSTFRRLALPLAAIGGIALAYLAFSLWGVFFPDAS
jgi:hypothetical protein